jgi:hypothetical protein
MLTYLSLGVAFFMTLVGIVGKTWNEKNKGLRRFTYTGIAVLLLALAAFGIGISEARKKDAQLRDITRIRHIANRQILDGVNYLVRHLLAEHVESVSNKALFDQIESSVNLDSIGRQCLVDPAGSDIADNYRGVGGTFNQPWQLIAFDVDHGRQLLDDTILKYGAFVEPDLIVRINEVLGDEFFVDRFSLGPSNKYFLELALAETKEQPSSCSGWGTLGHFYFNAVYIKGKERQPDYLSFLAFTKKLHSLVDYASEHDAMRVFKAAARAGS